MQVEIGRPHIYFSRNALVVVVVMMIDDPDELI